MKIELTRKQLYNLLFELITARTEEQNRLEKVFALNCSKEVTEYQQECVRRTDELMNIVNEALHTPFD